MLSKKTARGEHNSVVFTEDEFSIRVGHWSYFITHDPCNSKNNFITHDPCNSKNNSDIKNGIAFSRNGNGDCILKDKCETCDKRYSKEMGGFIQMLVWER
jgi:hypothetical protein